MRWAIAISTYDAFLCIAIDITKYRYRFTLYHKEDYLHELINLFETS
jgi:hypothetical protein